MASRQLGEVPLHSPEKVLSISYCDVDALLKSRYHPDYVNEVKEVFNRRRVRKQFSTEGPGFRETVPYVTAQRVTGQFLHDELLDAQGKPWLDRFYRTDLLRLIQTYLGNDKIYAAEDPNRAYTGNGLYEKDERFPFHIDTKRTASGVMFFEDLPSGYGGELTFIPDPNIRGFEQIREAFQARILPKIGNAYFFYGRHTHGSFPIARDAPPRPSIAFTYLLRGYNDGLRPSGFDINRK